MTKVVVESFDLGHFGHLAPKKPAVLDSEVQPPETILIMSFGASVLVSPRGTPNVTTR